MPILYKMYQLYQQPANMDRFNAYKKLLIGNTNNDMEVPISAYNPMAKEHVLEKMDELKKLHAEQLIQHTLAELNEEILYINDTDISRVVPGVSDDLKGGWTNRYTSDYDSKFKLNALIQRKFCTPIFWTSEIYTEEKIISRTREYCYRTIYWLTKAKPTTLEDHIIQEKTVMQQSKSKPNTDFDFETLNAFYQLHKHSTNYNTIFNFLYGDAAAESLGKQTSGIKEAFAGYGFAQILSTQ